MPRNRIPVIIVNLLLLSAGSRLAIAQGQQLQILVIGGEGSINNVKQRTAREPVVEVRDRNDRPVAGALVLFETPQRGASGAFPGGSRTLQVTTDAQGRAVGRGFQPNSVQGDMEIQVTASFQGATGAATIHMTNGGGGGASNAAKVGGHGKLIAILVTVGAAAAAGTAAAIASSHSGGGGGGTTGAVIPPGVSISAGTPAVGPHP